MIIAQTQVLAPFNSQPATERAEPLPYDFQACIGQIYPPELELKKTTESHDSCSYLDLNISILNGKFCTDLYMIRGILSASQ